LTGEPLFDLASLAKPLVTAPLALELLDLDRDRREQLGFGARSDALTVRQLLSHSAGLPPWLPFTGEALARQLARGLPASAHPKLARPQAGVSCYSDLGYRLLAELLELETGRDFTALGAERSGLAPAPWAAPPRFAPPGADLELWRLAEPDLPFPPRDPHLPHDANARAGMRGHAGFGATPSALRACLERWVAAGVPGRMAVDTAQGEDGSRWGLGLQRALTGPGRFGTLLAAIPPGAAGIHVLVAGQDRLSPPAPPLDPAPGPPSRFWFHLGYTGPALFVRPEDGLCIALLAHRLGPGGELLDAEQLRARRWEALAGAMPSLGAA
jgi:CubicO group peptidase (beta-lactamase class C family)